MTPSTRSIVTGAVLALAVLVAPPVTLRDRGVPAVAVAADDCACRDDTDNLCLFGPTLGCAMTQAGGYCDPDGDGDFADADWIRGWEEFRLTCSAPPPGTCGCRTDVDNFCLYGSGVPGCAMTNAGGYCDPDGNGDFADADWLRGWDEHRSACAAPPSDRCSCRPGFDNVCSYGPSAGGCDLTEPGGACDPDGDGDFSDADWVRGWFAHRALCDGHPAPSPSPTATPTPALRPRRIGLEGPVCLYYDELSVAWAVREGARIINNGATTARIGMRVQSVDAEPQFGDALQGTTIATGFFGHLLPPGAAFSGQFSFHADVRSAPAADEILVVSVIMFGADGRTTYTDFLSFGRIAEHLARPGFTACISAPPTTALP